MEEKIIDEKELEELEDFDLTDANYQVWLLGEDEKQNCTDFEYLVCEYLDSSKAVEYAEEIYDDPSMVLKNIDLPADTKIIVIQVETVIEYEGIETNVETIYRRKIELF